MRFESLVDEADMQPSDRDCIRECLNGHPEAYEHLLRRYQGALLSALTGELSNRTAAEEVAQECFVRAFFRLRSLRKQEALFPWLLGIARRIVQEQRRAAGRVRPLPPGESWAEGPGTSESGLDLERAVAELPEAYQQVILLRYYGGQSCSQVAELLGLPLGTVTKRLSRAHRLLREALREETSEIRQVRP